MRFQRYGKYDPEIKTKFKPIESIKRNVLSRLDHLLGMLLQHNPKIHQKFINELILKIKPLIKTNYMKINKIEISKNLETYNNLKKYPELAELIFNISIMLSKPLNDRISENNTIITLEKNVDRSLWFPLYYQALVLTEIVSKKMAFDIYKKHVRDYRENYQKIHKYRDLNEVRAFFIKVAQEGGNVHIISDITHGRLIVRRDNCTISEVFGELNDVELTHLVACSGDFDFWKASNPNIVLTRKYTLMEGYPYCDFVFHDIRVNQGLEHPPKEFFDNLGLNSGDRILIS